MKRKRIGVLAGGWSSEREISLLSGRNIYNSLKRQGFDAVFIDVDHNFMERLKEEKIDVAFVILHGKPGEDGTVQGVLELLSIPYTGSGVEASAISMDKFTTKKLFEAHKIPTPAYIFIPKDSSLEDKLKEAEERFGFPMVLKPRGEGSSVGVRIIKDPASLRRDSKEAKEKFGDIILEKYIRGMIATVGILNERPLPILEIIPKHQEFYNYKAKYTKGETEFIIPARLERDIYEKVQSLALAAHKAIGCWGFSRVDLIVEENTRPYLLEVNSIPGMTELSDLPAEASYEGMSYDELVFEILKSAFTRPQ